MEPKKNDKISLKKKRPIFFEIGLLSALLIAYGAFELDMGDAELSGIKIEQKIEIEDEIEIPQTEQVKEIKVQKIEIIVPEKLTVRDDDADIDEEFDMDDMEFDDDDNIEISTDLPQEEEEEQLFDFYAVEKKPTFPGGNLLKWLAENTKFPEEALERGISGKVYVQFTISKTGSVTDVKVMRGVSPSLDNEALRVVKMMPKWEPAQQSGKTVPVRYMIPVFFLIQQ